jgi:CRISPR/Cas system CSM-associated protein Csm3 (group 7 of RAMP superfamily)
MKIGLWRAEPVKRSMEKYGQDRVCWHCQAIFRDSFVTKTWDEEMEEQLWFGQEVKPNLLIKIKRSRNGQILL